ncbi:hypothetical protein H5410_022890 [Solanum commersonii]|uniref:Uncharacterized protein n=1 Tax=Solanum commersonii TaxID=4109 RepID=A0A9J5ZFB5_SOLCO|nr:hypothetical protein H5410_022890 [Solanum commersonii]
MTTQLIEGRVELTQEIDQFSSDINDLEAHLNKKIKASEAKLPIVVDDDQLVEQKEEFQPFNYTLFLNIDVEKEYKSENVWAGLLPKDLGLAVNNWKWAKTNCYYSQTKLKT